MVNRVEMDCEGTGYLYADHISEKDHEVFFLVKRMPLNGAHPTNAIIIDLYYGTRNGAVLLDGNCCIFQKVLIVSSS